MPYIVTGSGFGDAEPIDQYGVCDVCHDCYMIDDLTEHNVLLLCGECLEETNDTE